MLNALIGCIPMGVGILMVALGVFFYVRTKNFVGRSQEVKGTVTELAYESDSDGSGYYTVFQFTTLTGQRIEAAGNVRSNPASHKLGEVIDVLYDPANPNDARIKKTSTLYFVPMLLSGMGGVFFCLGVAFFVLFALGVIKP